MSPRPCVRPGKVASMTTAATTTFTQPRRIAPASAVQPRPVVGIVEDGAGVMRLDALSSNASLFSVSSVAQKVTPALNPNVRGAPFSPTNPDGASGP